MKTIYAAVLCFVMLSACQLVNNEPDPRQIETNNKTSQWNAKSTSWTPALRQSWQWQLSGEIDLSTDAQVFDLDLFETDPQMVADLHAKGKWVICYINVGAWENWREDRELFPESILGMDYSGWKGERWLDIRQIDLLKPIMDARFDLCRQKGFDAVEPDNIDGYTNETGFPLTYDDQLQYNLWLAEEAHARGLMIGLKNNPDQVDDLVDVFDWAMTEDCFDQDWCEQMLAFVRAGKPVFAAEYTDTGVDFNAACAAAEGVNFNLILKNRELDAFRRTCP